MKTTTSNNDSWNKLRSSISERHLVKWTQQTLYTRNYDFEEEYNNPEAELIIHTKRKNFNGAFATLAKSIDQYGKNFKIVLKGSAKQYPLLSRLKIKRYSNYLMLSISLEEDRLIGEKKGVIESENTGISIIFMINNIKA
jgi:hypothetical protein